MYCRFKDKAALKFGTHPQYSLPESFWHGDFCVATSHSQRGITSVLKAFIDFCVATSHSQRGITSVLKAFIDLADPSESHRTQMSPCCSQSKKRDLLSNGSIVKFFSRQTINVQHSIAINKGQEIWHLRTKSTFQSVRNDAVP